jgi:hypothetical protein
MWEVVQERARSQGALQMITISVPSWYPATLISLMCLVVVLPIAFVAVDAIASWFGNRK